MRWTLFPGLLCLAVGCATAKSENDGSSSTAGAASASSTSNGSTGVGTGSSSTSGTTTTSNGTATGSATTTGSSSSGGGAGTPCGTAADCRSLAPTGQVCLDGGGCGTAPASVLGCVAVGLACQAGVPCCESACDDGGLCPSWVACAFAGDACATDSDCCFDERCGSSGTCVASCGSASAPCSVDSDCCLPAGLTCQSAGGGLSVCGVPLTFRSCVSTLAAGGTQCNLGTTCEVRRGVDPCGPAGLVCDPFFGTCRDPADYEICLPGGPPCQGLAESTVDDLQCLPYFDGLSDVNVCLQPCQTTGDCLFGITSCQSVGVGQQACLFGGLCLDFLQVCNAAGTNDGTCEPYTSPGSATTGFCGQGATDAGTGTCSLDATRENGSFCPPEQDCLGGLCQPICNASGSASATCATGTTCVAINGQTSDAVDFGSCAQSCDYLDPDGGGCDAGPDLAVRCLPSIDLGLLDDGKGLCVRAQPGGPSYGQDCQLGGTPTVVDVCAEGTTCGLIDDATTCLQLCKQGEGTCPPGTNCTPLYYNGVPQPLTGICR